MYARLYLAWLAIAIIAVFCQSFKEYDEDLEDFDSVPMKIRNALAEEAFGVLDEHGEKVDVSLDGYDHDLVARDLEDKPVIKGHEARDAGLDNEALRKLGRMRPRYVQHEARDADVEDDEDDEDDDTPNVDLDPKDEDEGKDHGPDATSAGIAPDPKTHEPDELAQLPVATRDVHDEDDFKESYAEEDDENEEPGSYDAGLYSRSSEHDDEIDYSLEGYNPSVLRRGEDGDDEDFDEEAFDGSTGKWYSSERRNARSEDDEESEPNVLLGEPFQVKENVVPEVELDDDEDDGAFSRAWSQVRRWAEDVLT